MELYQLRTFVTVADAQSVTHAAERLYTTPPSVSAHIKALEQELNVTLFVRTPRGMVLTPAGELLRGRAEQVLRAAEAVLAEAATLQVQLAADLRIGVNAAPSLLRVPQLISAAQRAHPGLRLQLVASVSGRIRDQLRRGELDAGFFFGPLPHAGLRVFALNQVDLVVAAPRSWEPQLAGGRWEDIACLPWIASTVDCPFEAISDALFAGYGRTPRKVVMADDALTKVDLIRAGVGAAVLEEGEAQEAVQEGGVLLWRPAQLSATLYFAWPSTRDEDPALSALCELVAQVWGVAAGKIGNNESTGPS
ncbi:MAG TPA: LysR family transcriptional regulator [Caldilineaceae bacterium]|nr:LysR family transcriptional regulator [Caldilineaceae bacterium]